MALALPSSRVFLASLAHLRPAWSLPCLPSSSTSPLPQNRWYTALIPSLSSLIELFPPILLAVPKSRVTHSRKSMRSANKGLKNKSNFSHCEACGSIKLSHNVCPSCYSQISRRWKAEARSEIPSTQSKAESASP